MGRARLVSLLALLPLAGCLEFESQSSVSWSPDGGRVAFLSEGRPWIYTLDTGAVTPLPGEGSYLGLAWSPRADWLAVSTAAYVETFRAGEAGFESVHTFSTREPESRIMSLMWHPDGRRLLYSEVTEKAALTTEVDVDSGTVSKPGRGIGLYGPGGDWLLWAVPLDVGRRETLFLERQSTAGAVLPLTAPTFEQDALFTLLPGISDFSPLPLCGVAGKEYVCLGSDKRLAVPENALVFADRRRELLAVVEEPASKEPRLRIVDWQGRPKADGAGFLKAIRSAAGPGEADKETVSVSRLAWSPDGNWLAWVVEGRLCLWNWRNDEVRVHRAPGAAQ